MLQRTHSYSNIGSTVPRSLSRAWGRTAPAPAPGSWPSSARPGSASSSPAPGTATAPASALSNAKAGRRGAARSAASSDVGGGEAAGAGGGAPVRSSPRSRLIVVGSWSWPPSVRRQGDVCPPWWSGAGTGLARGAARGNPAPTRGPAGCLLDGLPPGRRPRQGRCAVLRTGLRPPLTRPSSRRPGETRSPGAGEEQRPTSRQHTQEVRP